MANPEQKHARYSFSSRARWRACPASVAMSQGIADTSGPAAAEGTLAHLTSEWYQGPQVGEPPFHQPPEGLDMGRQTVAEWNADMQRHGGAFADWVRGLAGSEGFIAVERRVSIPSISQYLFGTADRFVWLPSTATLHVPDYKYGHRPVDLGTVVNSNPQLSAYAVAAVETFKLPAKRIVLHIAQPRLMDNPQPLTIEDAPSWLTAERAKLTAEVAAIEAGNTAPNPGEHCRYCKAKSKCPAIVGGVARAFEVAAGVTDVLSLPADELLNLYASRKAIEALMEDVAERVTAMARTGHRRIAVKETQGRRIWKDPRDAALTLLALGRTDLLQPIALSDALTQLPEQIASALVSRSRPGVSISVSDTPAVHVMAETFRKYVSGAQNAPASPFANTSG